MYSKAGNKSRYSGPRRMLPGRLLALALLAVSAGPGGPAARASDADAWQALRAGGHFAMIRHALAPGTGDPPGFRVEDCTTQRNLSAGGRDQASRIGAAFRANGLGRARVFSSQWCRCLETARLLGLGEVEELPALNSFFSNREQRGPQTSALAEWLGKRDLGSPPVVLVTHQVNISALTGSYASSGEMVVARLEPDGNVVVAGTVAMP